MGIMISIVIPVYNVEKYLDECIQSVVDQVYKGWECILVDDGSEDRSGLICDKWAEKDKRIISIHQYNQGVSVARNHGIKVSKGEYITFIDSDDYVDSNYLSNLLHTEGELVISGHLKEYENGKSEEFCPLVEGTFVMASKNEDRMVDLLKKSLLYGPTNKLYKRSIIIDNDIKFPKHCSYGEDLEFNFQYLKYVISIHTIAKADYHYRIIGCGTLSSVVRTEAFAVDYRQWCIVRALLQNKDLWGKIAQAYMFKRLWGIVYDGLFSKRVDAKTILSVPEIPLLKKYGKVFECSFWIKFCIINKLYFVFRWI